MQGPLLDAVLRSAAVACFLDRALAAAPQFTPDRNMALAIAAICRRLDGIPLAIERSTDVALERFLAWAHSHQGALVISRGDSDAGVRLVRASIMRQP